jgi:hypothetical protein
LPTGLELLSSDLCLHCTWPKVLDLIRKEKNLYGRNNFFLCYWGLNQGLRLAKAGIPSSQNKYFIFEIVKKEKEIFGSFATIHQTAKVYHSA